MIITQACYTWQPLYGEILGKTTLSQIDLESSISNSPRAGAAINCPNC